MDAARDEDLGFITNIPSSQHLCESHPHYEHHPGRDGGRKRNREVDLKKSQSVPHLRVVNPNHTEFSRDDESSFSSNIPAKKSGRRNEYPVYAIDNTYGSRDRSGSMASSCSSNSGSSRPKDAGGTLLGKRQWGSNDGLTNSFAESVNVSTPRTNENRYKRFKIRNFQNQDPDTPCKENEKFLEKFTAESPDMEEKENDKEDVDYSKMNSFLREIRLNRDARKERPSPPAAVRRAHSSSNSKKAITCSSSKSQRGSLLSFQSKYVKDYQRRQKERSHENHDDMAVDGIYGP